MRATTPTRSSSDATPEISVMRPTDFARKALAFVGIPDAFVHFGILARNALGRFGPDERDYIPDSDLPRAIFWARVFVGDPPCGLGLGADRPGRSSRSC